MKDKKIKIGFLDYYLDEWHADNYPKMLQEHSQGKMEVTYAYGMIPSPRSGKTSEEWCKEHKIEYCVTIEEVIDKSDVLMVLAPENAEMHEALSELPLKSGKKTYIDKTFALTKKSAETIFGWAKMYGTPCYSTSALRYASEYQAYKGKQIHAASFIGASTYNNYSIHHLEPMMMLMKGKVLRVMALNRLDWAELLVEWTDGKVASAICTGGDVPFTAKLLLEKSCETIEVKSDFFGCFVDDLIRFFETGKAPVAHEETIKIIAVREAGLKALENPGQWIFVE